MQIVFNAVDAGVLRAALRASIPVIACLWCAVLGATITTQLDLWAGLACALPGG
jgi:tryptophan-rich sensory protein